MMWHESIIVACIMEGTAWQEPDVFGGICHGNHGIIIWGTAASAAADDWHLGTAGIAIADRGNGSAGEAREQAEDRQ